METVGGGLGGKSDPAVDEEAPVDLELGEWDVDEEAGEPTESEFVEAERAGPRLENPVVLGGSRDAIGVALQRQHFG